MIFEIINNEVEVELQDVATVTPVRFEIVQGGNYVIEQLQSDWNEADTESKAFILNKPTIPVIDPDTVIDADYATDKARLANTSGANTGDQTAADVTITDAGDLYGSDNVEGALQEVGTLATTNFQNIQLKQDSTSIALNTTSKEVVGAINEVRAIALAIDAARAFDTEAEMFAWLAIPANVATLKIGNLLLIRDVLVPDYWWDGNIPLELEVKIDLTNYYNKGEIDTLLSGKQDTLTFSTDIEADKASTTKVSAIKTFYDWAVGKFGALATINTWALLQTFTSGVKTGKIQPIADGTTAVQITKADGTTAVVNIDTTNGRVGIGLTPTYILDATTTISSLLRMARSGGYGSLRASTSGIGLVIGNDTTSVTNGILGLFANGDASNPALFILQNQNIASLIEKYQYQSTSPTADTINDTRFRNSGGVIIYEVCTGNSVTKGSGTWVETHRIVNGSVRTGGATNYTECGVNGLKLVGTATQYDDETSAGIDLLQTGSGISKNVPEATVDYTNAANTADYAVAVMQMKHSWKLASIIYPHIHWLQNSANTPNWVIQYRWQINGQAKETAWTALSCKTNAFTYVSGTLNQISKPTAGITPPANATLSDIIQFRIVRDTGNTLGVSGGADNYTGTAQMLSFDYHFEKDSIGSNDEYVK